MKIRSILASGTLALAVAGTGVATAGAASAHPRPVPTATGSVALAGSQYVSFTASAGPGRHHGQIDYANFMYRAFGTNVWNIMGKHALVFAGSSGTQYAHTMKVTSITPVSTVKTTFLGTGSYNADPKHYAWTVTGTVDKNVISFKITYASTSADPGYWVSGTGVIAPNGSVSSTNVLDRNGNKLTFTMPAGSAFQVLRYTAPVTWAVIKGHDARFGYVIPKGTPWWLAGKSMVVKVHDGGRYHHDTYASGFGTFWRTGLLRYYPITSGDILVHS
jgi:hypothetical protein